MMAGVALAALAGVAAAEPGVVAVSLKNHVFTPSTINVAAGQRVQIELTNQD